MASGGQHLWTAAEDTEWRPPPKTTSLHLPPDEVHIWRASLDQPPAQVDQLARTLSGDEQRRAARFHFSRDRRRFVVGRGMLRTILGGYLGLPPEAVRFDYGARGKPALAEGSSPARPALRFNLAHSEELALYAFAWGREVGIDVERVRPLADADAIVSRFFSAREGASWHRLPEEERPAAFFRGWTRKEAYIKAVGDGLALPLDRFDVPLGPEEGQQELCIAGDPAEALRWALVAFTPAAGYPAALAVEGWDWRRSYWQYA